MQQSVLTVIQVYSGCVDIVRNAISHHEGVKELISIENYKKYPKIKSTKFFNNGPKYLDPFRKRLDNVTPEEKVRLRTAFFLRDVLGIPLLIYY